MAIQSVEGNKLTNDERYVLTRFSPYRLTRNWSTLWVLIVTESDERHIQMPPPP